MGGYIELHARSAFSFLRGASLPEQLAEVAGQAGLAAMALCDRNGVYGAPRFHCKAAEFGVRPIVGAELAMKDQTVLPVLVASRIGYQNLCRLITKAQLRSPKGESQIDWPELPEFAEGLVVLTGDEEGPLYGPIFRGNRDLAEERIKTLVSTFGAKNVYVELQRHLLQGDDRIVEGLVQLAEAQGLPLLATNAVQYAHKWGRCVQDVFTCLRHHTTLDGAGLLLAANSERRIKSPQAMTALFRDLPDAILNTERLADRLLFTLNDLGYEFPRFPVAEGETMESTLRKLTLFGAQQRYGSLADPVRSQLDKELALIFKLGFSGIS